MGGIEDVPYSVLFRRPYPEDVRVEKFLVIVGRFTIICSEAVTSKNNIYLVKKHTPVTSLFQEAFYIYLSIYLYFFSFCKLNFPINNHEVWAGLSSDF